VRSFRLLLGLGVLAAARSAAAADPPPKSAPDHPLFRLVEAERMPLLVGRRVVSAQRAGNVVRPPTFGEEVSALDCEHARHDIRLDPKTGETKASLELRVRANGRPVSRVALSLDEGLHVGAVTADARTVTVDDAVYAPTRIVELRLSPALAAGQSTVIRVPYEGTLACGTYPEGGGVLCTKADDFSYFAHQSVVPYIFDPTNYQGGASTLDAMTREIFVRVPDGTDVVATGEKIGETVEGGTKTSAWIIDRPLSRSLGFYIFAGKLGLRTVPGRTVPTTFVFPNPEMDVDKRLVAWSAPVLDFVERLAGGPLPFQRSLTLVRLPANIGDPGTATFGMTLLSDSYARTGDLMHEETWAHENAHLFWGIIVPETSSAESRMMSEGLATLTEIDYTHGAHFAGVDRDEYLARRFVPIGLDLRANGKDLPPVQLTEGAEPPDGFRTSLYTLWAYYKTSATLDHLRVTVGDDVFARGLAAYVKKCSYVGCSPTDFRGVLEKESGKDLGPFFARWVTATSRPEVTVGFAPVPGGADVELTKDDDEPMTLELWLTLDDGQRIKRSVDLVGRTTQVHVATSAWVRTVSPNPRHDVLVDSRSTVEGDIDFDGETDGFDVLRCTPLVGKSYKPVNAVGLWTVDERFDPRCDVNGDRKIDDSDIEALTASFGTLRGAR